MELVDSNEEKMNACYGELSKFNVKLSAHKVDLSKKAEIERLWVKLGIKDPIF